MNPSIYCVDLDKTLIKQDTTLELIKTEIRNNPKIIFNLIVALYHHEWRGFKSKLVSPESINSIVWQIRPDIETELLRLKKDGAMLYLVTASQPEVASYFFEKYKFFTGFICSEGIETIKGKHKFRKMQAFFGEQQQLLYIGDSFHDIAIWREIGQAILPKEKKLLELYLKLFFTKISITVI